MRLGLELGSQVLRLGRVRVRVRVRARVSVRVRIRVWVGARLEERRRGGRVPHGHRLEQGRRSVRLCAVGVGARLEQQLHHLDAALDGRGRERLGGEACNEGGGGGVGWGVDSEQVA